LVYLYLTIDTCISITLLAEYMPLIGVTVPKMFFQLEENSFLFQEKNVITLPLNKVISL